MTGRVRDAADDIKDIEKQERTEKELRVAEMETNKALYAPKKISIVSVVNLQVLRFWCDRNLLKHSKEIHSRPARTWFQDEKEKNNVVKRWREVRVRLLPRPLPACRRRLAAAGVAAKADAACTQQDQDRQVSGKGNALAEKLEDAAGGKKKKKTRCARSWVANSSG